MEKKIVLSGLLLLFLQFPHALAEKVFVFCSEAGPSSFGPAIFTGATALDASQYTIYSNLLRFKLGETTLLPSLAERWDISPDGLTYTFHLRKEVKFHSNRFFRPSRNFQADDVLFTFNRQRQKDHPFHAVNGGTYELFTAMEMGSTIKDIVKRDDYTVQFILNHPYAPFLSNLAMAFTSIYSKEYGDFLAKRGQKEKIDFEPIGTGPFIFDKYQKDTLIRYEANGEYFLGRPSIDKLIFTIIPDSSVRYQKLKAGECHFIADPSPSDIPAIKKDKNLLLMAQEGLNVGYLAMNVERPPFNDRTVRQAINLALNRKAYIDAIFGGLGQVAENPLPPTLWSYLQKGQSYPYDPAQARRLLKRAGFPQGFSTEMWILPIPRPYNPNGKKMGEMMQADLKAVGITVKLISFDWPTYLNQAREGRHFLIQSGWVGDNGDPDNFLGVLLSCAGVTSGSNYARWCHRSFEELIQEAKKTPGRIERTKLYERAQVIFKEEVPWVPLAHSLVYKAMSRKVKGFIIDPMGANVFTQVDLEGTP